MQKVIYIQQTLIFIFALLTLTTFSQGTVEEKFNAYVKEDKKNKTFLIKEKQEDSKEYFYFTKDSKQFCGYQIYNKVNGAITKYFFKDGQLAFVIYLLRPSSKESERQGGLYYFVDGKLQEKEEYNIAAQDQNQLLTEAEKIKIKAKDLIEKKS